MLSVSVTNIRQYKAKDVPSIIELFSELQEAEHNVEPNRRTGMDAARTYFGKVHKRLMRKKGKLFVAEHQHKIIGLIVLFIKSNDIIERYGKHIYISDIVVKKEYRGKGIGMELIQKAEIFARKHRIKEIRVTSLIKNTAALSLYHKANFQDKEISLAKTINDM